MGLKISDGGYFFGVGIFIILSNILYLIDLKLHIFELDFDDISKRKYISVIISSILSVLAMFFIGGSFYKTDLKLNIFFNVVHISIGLIFFLF